MQLRVKQDPKLFEELWRAQIGSRQYAMCARMLESCILAQKEHSRVAISEIIKRTGATISELAQILTDAGGVSPGKIIAACPDSDTAKSGLVEEMLAGNQARINASRCEDRHPFVLTMAFVSEVASSTRRYDSRKRVFVPNI